MNIPHCPSARLTTACVLLALAACGGTEKASGTSQTTAPVSSATPEVRQPVASAPTPAPPTAPLSQPSPPAVAGVELPRVYLNTDPVAITGRTITVAAGGDFQAALHNAQPGDAIILQAGATFIGNFVLPAKTGAGWITIRSSAPDASLPAPGQRMTPSYAASLPKLMAAEKTEPVIRTALGANHYRLIALEVTAQPTHTMGYTMMAFGDGTANTVSGMPSNIVLDRMYIHGTPTLDFQRCIALNSASTAIVDSWISDCHGKGYDSQAIWGSNGTGPYKIVNNYLEGAGENVMFGGSDPRIVGQVPADIEIRRNHFFKPLSWQGVWTVKNLFELKIGKRVLVEGNVFENCWGDAQLGFGIVLKSTNQDNSAPWSETGHVTFRYNVLRNSTHGIGLAGNPETHPAVLMNNVYIGQNSFEQIGTGTGAFEGGRVFQIADVPDLTIESNSGVGPLNGFLFHGGASPRMVIRNNAIGLSASRYGGWGQTLVSADNRGGGKDALAYHAPGAVFAGNLLWGGNAAYFAAENFFPADPTAAGFTSFPGNLEPTASSPYRAAGVDYPKLRAMVSGVVVAP